MKFFLFLFFVGIIISTFPQEALGTSSFSNDTDITTPSDVDNGTDCGDVPEISNGRVELADMWNRSVGATAYVKCDVGYVTDIPTLTCQESGLWQDWDKYAVCLPVDCGPLPYIQNGAATLRQAGNTTYQALANVTCTPGFEANSSFIKCLETGLWENVTCEIEGCRTDELPHVDHGMVIPQDEYHMLSKLANVSCDAGYAATVPLLRCLDSGKWENNSRCVIYDLGIVRIVTEQDVSKDSHTSYLRCQFNAAVGLLYRVKWYFEDIEIKDSGLLNSVDSVQFVLTDDMLTSLDGFDIQGKLFGAKITCATAVYDGFGETEFQNMTSMEFVPIDVSTSYITMLRGKQATLTVYLNLPFGCPMFVKKCHLRFLLYESFDDWYRCYRSSVAAIHGDTCGGKIDVTSKMTSQHVTNITITTKNNRYYWARSHFPMILRVSAVGNNKTIWNEPSTTVTVWVQENYYTWYRGCYSFVDPYMYTFDGRYYSNQLLENFVFLRHKSLPIEIQTVTAPCNGGWATCSCAVTVRAGGDVFTINHCGGHLTDYLSAKDRIIKVYRWWTTFYQIVLPTGMEVYVYIMPYFEYMMNVYAIAPPSDFEETEGLCGNFNGNYRDDTRLRGTNILSNVEINYGYWWWWYWWNDYFYPHDFAYSWGLEKTKKYHESLLNPQVYRNVKRWDEDKKFCVCQNALYGNYEALCSADEEATCAGYYWRWGTLVEPSSSRVRREAGRIVDSFEHEKNVEKRLLKMREKWKLAVKEHRRNKREVNSTHAITFEEAQQLCEETLSNCNAYTKKDEVEEVAESNDTLTNCARDVMIDGTTTWVLPHCDAFTQKVTVQVDKDTEFAKNHSEVVKDIQDNSCPGNCSGHGRCVNKTCVCDEDFATDLCLVNVTEPPALTELGDDGICDVSTGSACDYILIVGDGFVENVTCKITLYAAGTDGIFYEKSQVNESCLYLNFNEISAPSTDESSARRRREVENTSIEFARMVEVSVSNNGVNFGDVKNVVVLDTTCQQTGVDSQNKTVVTLKAGYCYIAGSCYTEGSFRSNSDCNKCVTSENVFIWTNVCNPDNEKWQTIVPSVVGGAVFIIIIVVVVAYFLHRKLKANRTIFPATFGASNVKFGLEDHHPLPKAEAVDAMDGATLLKK